MKRIILSAVLAASCLSFSGTVLADDVIRAAVAPAVSVADDSIQLAAARPYYAPRYYPGPRYYSYRPYYYRPYSGYYYGYRPYSRYYYSPYVGSRYYPDGDYYIGPRGRVLVY